MVVVEDKWTTRDLKIKNLVHLALLLHLTLVVLGLNDHLLCTNKNTIPKQSHQSNFSPLCCILFLALLFLLYYLKKINK